MVRSIVKATMGILLGVCAVMFVIGAWNPFATTKTIEECPEGMTLVRPRGSSDICVIGVRPTYREVPI